MGVSAACLSNVCQNLQFKYFWIIKFLSFFSKDPLIVLYFFSYFVIFLIAISANFCFREIGISEFNSTFLAVLFAITNNKFNYLSEVSVGNYFIIPFAILISFSIINDKLNALKSDKNGKIFISPNKYFYYAMILGCIASSSSAYYGYLYIILLFLSGIILLFRNQKLNKAVFSVGIIVILLILISILINFPTLIFWWKNGKNEIISRRSIEIIKHGISIASLMLPIEDHVIKSFGEFAIAFKKDFLLNWEKGFHQLGALASIGFCSLLGFSLSSMFLIQQKDPKYKFYGLEFKQEKYYILSVIASLNLLLILFLHSESFLLFLHFYFYH
jgi:hypothetical protein